MHNVITICSLVVNAKPSHEYWLVLLSWLEQNFCRSLFLGVFSPLPAPRSGRSFWFPVFGSRVRAGLLCFPRGLRGGGERSNAVWEGSSRVQPPAPPEPGPGH